MQLITAYRWPSTLSSTDQSVRDYIGYVEARVDCQVINGMLSNDEANVIELKLSEAVGALPTDLNKANVLAHQAWFDFVSDLNKKSGRYRLLYMYAIPVWVFVVALSISLLTIIYTGYLNHPIFIGVSADSIAWGGLGGCGYAIYQLRDLVSAFYLSKYEAIYYMVYPTAGMIFGLATVFLIASGLLSLGATPTYPVYVSIAFLSGIFQEWVIATLKDISQAIHKTTKD